MIKGTKQSNSMLKIGSFKRIFIEISHQTRVNSSSSLPRRNGWRLSNYTRLQSTCFSLRKDEQNVLLRQMPKISNPIWERRLSFHDNRRPDLISELTNCVDGTRSWAAVNGKKRKDHIFRAQDARCAIWRASEGHWVRVWPNWIYMLANRVEMNCYRLLSNLRTASKASWIRSIRPQHFIRPLFVSWQRGNGARSSN